MSDTQIYNITLPGIPDHVLPCLRACAITSAVLLLMTLVMYKGQFAWLANAVAWKTAAASVWKFIAVNFPVVQQKI